MKERKLGWDNELNTGTVKINSVEFFKQIEQKDTKINRLREALEEIRDSKECEVCKCSQYAGKTYDGLSFVILQKMAKRALKNEY